MTLPLRGLFRALRIPIRRWAWGWVVLGPCALGAAVMSLAHQRPRGEHRSSLHAPGGERFAMYTQEGENAQAMSHRCRAGDRLLASYRSDKPYLLVVQIDGSQRAQIVFPEAGAWSAAIATAAAQLTPGRWILDATPGVERFVAVFSSEPLDAAEVLESLQHDALPSGPDVAVQEARCRKEG